LQELNSLQTINRLGQHLKSRRGLSREKIKEIMSKAGQLQRQAGYQGNYKEWIRQNLPIRLENML
jgi:hypothetical protein